MSMEPPTLFSLRPRKEWNFRMHWIWPQNWDMQKQNPTADIEGLDHRKAKVAILASVAFNSRVVLDDVTIEGITKITATDIRYMGCTIKLLGVTRCTEDGVEAYVNPMLIPSSHPTQLR